MFERGRDRAATLGTTLLMDDAAVIGDVRFLGGTLWTDFLFGSFSLTHAFRTARPRRDGGLPPHPDGAAFEESDKPGDVLTMHHADPPER